MFFRFGAALCSIVLIALWGTSLEKRNLELKRAISQQHYRHDALVDMQVRLKLEAQRLGAPSRLLESLDRSDPPAIQPGGKHRANQKRTDQKPTVQRRTGQKRAALQNWNSE